MKAIRSMLVAPGVPTLGYGLRGFTTGLPGGSCTMRRARSVLVESDEPVPYHVDGDPGGVRQLAVGWDGGQDGDRPEAVYADHDPIVDLAVGGGALHAWQHQRAFVQAVNRAKPSGAKGTYLKKIALSSTMGPGVTVDIASAVAD